MDEEKASEVLRQLQREILKDSTANKRVKELHLHRKDWEVIYEAISLRMKNTIYGVPITPLRDDGKYGVYYMGVQIVLIPEESQEYEDLLDAVDETDPIGLYREEKTEEKTDEIRITTIDDIKCK